MEHMADAFAAWEEAMKDIGLGGDTPLPDGDEIDGSAPDTLQVVDTYST